MSTAASAVSTRAMPTADLRLPGMLVIGAMKASTTAFYELLTRHPGVWMPSVKEPHYFTAKDYGEDGALRRYAALFQDAPQGVLLGEASTGYSKLPDLGPTPQRVRETLGAPRLIYLVRDPVDRIVSNFRHSHLAGHYQNGLSLTEAVQCDPILVTASLYARQIRAYHDEFGAEGLLVLTTDELHGDPRAAMSRVESFLGLPPLRSLQADWPEEMPRANSQRDLSQSVAAGRLAPEPLRRLTRRLLPSAAVRALKRLVPVSKSSHPIAPHEILLLQSLVQDDLADLRGLLGERIDRWPSVARMEAAG
ncbi:Sulfotransferase domain protein [Botrimarina colliarenosi]|uniref:Sulfotransferase domain protein n=1 Tax=Botrimarina colliarenosi TaxID=2528001 RepID=A0A5C6AEW9_9BACT|nr:sulfotransferase [Botrimarina colliarenosi]TWT97601.1 Sulfotransferase domain protein [Botrimarina colliarenosi]